MTAFPEKPIGMADAAAHLGVSRRTLTDALKRLPHYELRGRKKVFYPEHIAQLRQGMHECAFKSDGSTGGPTHTAPAPMARGSDALSALRMLVERKRRART